MDVIPVIIPVFNQPGYTQVCLESIFEADLGNCASSILPIIIDNGSRPRIQKLFDSWVEKYDKDNPQGINRPVIIRIKRNKGFAAAINEGFRHINQYVPSDEVVVLHNDTVVLDGWIGELQHCLRTEGDEVAVAVPQTNYANEMGPCIELLRMRFETIKPSNKQRALPDEINSLVHKTYPEGKKLFLGSIQDSEPRFTYVPEIASFCMMFRRSLLDEYPWFDEEFFLRTYEDKLWFLPMERDGLVCMLASRACVHHFGNITSDGPGYNFSEGVKINKELFDDKVRKINKKGPSSTDKSENDV